MASEKLRFLIPKGIQRLKFCCSDDAEHIDYATALMNAATKEQSYDEIPEEVAEDDATTFGVSVSASNNENENSENPENEGSLYRWSAPCVLLFLETYRRLEEKFLSGKQSHKKIWEEVSQILEKEGYTVTGPQCASKLRSLKKTYKSIKDHNNKSGNDKRTWPFYEIMDEIFSKKAWCAPVAVASSSGISIKSVSESECISLKESPKTSVTTLLAKRIRQKEEQEESRNKRHKEKLEMDQKFLDILEKLVEKKNNRNYKKIGFVKNVPY